MAQRKPPEKIPTGADAEEELRRLRRNARRKRRAAIKRGELSPEELAQEEAPTPPVDFDGKLPSPDELKVMFNAAFAELGGVAGLVSWGRRYPKEFYAIWSRICIPKSMSDGPPPENSLESLLSQLGD